MMKAADLKSPGVSTNSAPTASLTDTDLAAAQISSSRPLLEESGKLDVNGNSEGFESRIRVVADHVAQLFVKAESAFSEFVGTLYAITSFFSKNRGSAAAVGAAAALAASSGEALANQQPDGMSDTDYLRYGQQLQTNMPGPTVWVRSVDQNGNPHTASGIYWDALHIVTAGHVKITTGITNTILQVGLGSSMSNQCQVANVTDAYVHPSWISNNFTHQGDSLDLAVLTLDRPINATNAVVGPAPARFDICSSSGFGLVNTPSGGQKPFDGNIRGWTAMVSRLGSTGGSFSANYILQYFDGSLPGGLWYGDSGGAMCNEAGQVVGMNVSWASSDATFALRMDVAEPWVASTIAAEQPRILGIVHEGNSMRVKWRATAGSSYVVQASSDLTSPASFSDISPAISLGTGAVSGVMEYVDDGALTNNPTRFYRVKKL
jgi:hypothetical protein